MNIASLLFVMTTHGIPAFDKTLQKTNEWITLMAEVLDLEDRHLAYGLLRETLHALRDLLPVSEAVHLGAQLPMLLRGAYYDGWRAEQAPHGDRTLAAFLERVRSSKVLPPDLQTQVYAEKVARAVFRTLSSHVTPGETRVVRHVLSGDIQALWSDDR